MDDHRVGRGVAWSILALAIFAGWFVVTRVVMAGDLLVWDIVALRYGGGTLVLLPVLLGQCRRLNWRCWAQGLLLAGLWGAPFVMMVSFGLRRTSAADAASITPGLMPLFAGLFAWLVRGQRPSGRRLAGYAVILLGVIGLVGPGADPSGVAALVVAGSTWAIYTLRFEKSGLSPLQAVALVCFWSAVLYLPAYVLSGVSRLPHASATELGFQAVYQGVLMSVVAILAYNRAVGLLGSVAAASIPALLPVVTTLAALLILGEYPTVVAWVAITMIACGVALAAAKGRTGAMGPVLQGGRRPQALPPMPEGGPSL